MADENEKKEGAEGSAEATGEAVAEDGGKAKKKKMMLIISSAVAVLGILVAVGVVFFMGGEEKHDTAAAAEEGGETAHLVIYDVPEFNLSLLSEDPSTPHFIKMKVALELAKQTDAEVVNQALPKLQDDWGGMLRQMRVSDLQGSANLHRLKENLLRHAMQSLEPVEVKAVYIRELLVQ